MVRSKERTVEQRQLKCTQHPIEERVLIFQVMLMESAILMCVARCKETISEVSGVEIDSIKNDKDCVITLSSN